MSRLMADRTFTNFSVLKLNNENLLCLKTKGVVLCTPLYARKSQLSLQNIQQQLPVHGN